MFEKITQKIKSIFDTEAEKPMVNTLPRILAGTMEEFKQRILDSDDYVAGVKPLQSLIDSMYEEKPTPKDLARMAGAFDLVNKMADGNPAYQIYVDDAADISRMAEDSINAAKVQRGVNAASNKMFNFD